MPWYSLTTFPILEFQNCIIFLLAEFLHGSYPGFPFLETSPFVGPSYEMAQGFKQTLLTLLHHWGDLGALFFLFIMTLRNCLPKTANLLSSQIFQYDLRNLHKPLLSQILYLPVGILSLVGLI